MSTAVGDKVGERPPDWSPVPEPRTGGSATAVAGVVLRAAVGGAVAVFLWWLGHRFAAVALTTVLVLGTIASLLFPSVAGRIDHATRAVQRVAGRLLAFVLLGGVQLLVFTPISLLLRLVRHDPLSLGSSRDDATFWRPRAAPPGRPLYRRPFTYERRLPRPAGVGRGRLPLLRLRAVVGLVALLVLLDLGAGLAYDALVDTSSLGSSNVPAGRHEPWRSDLGDEFQRAWVESRYDPYLGFKGSDFHGRYLNVDGGVRRSYQPAGAIGDGEIRVFFFGGSAMFGLFQRDQHTIPSEVARLAAADGIRLRVANYGQGAYVNWQEVLLLEQLVTGRSVPDLAVFYDGFNDLGNQFRLGLHSEPSHYAARQKREEHDASPLAALYNSWAEVSVLARTVDRLWHGVHRERWEGRPQDAARNAALIYNRGRDLARRLARSYGFRTAFFWQPNVYSKRVVPGEKRTVGPGGDDPLTWRRADDAARSRIDPSVHDLGGALDGIKTPVMYDWVHTNELGAKVLARAIYERLRPLLRRFSAEKRG